MRKLMLASCQFPVTGNLVANGDWILQQMKEARRRGARLAHFSEAALSGYAVLDPPIRKERAWRRLHDQTARIMQAAAELRLWVVLGSTHRLTGDHLPHNSLYVIDDRGKLLTRYDKVFCCGRGGARPTDDLKHYSPGSDLVTFEVSGVRLGLLICHDFRYPELYREYKRRGIDLVLHSYHNSCMTAKRFKYYEDQVRAVIPRNPGHL
ncbi:MAG: carbon-nitrogen hydrolase family protein [Opitutaceae bacterium]|nr:carbon-nitrogen hydrolase family protein [Opitutaceae bacterium]